jgi:hypothetical protein
MNFSAKNPTLRQAENRCTKGSLREPFVQRAAAAPQLHKVLAALALRTTAVLQNSKKNPRYAQFFFATSQSRSALAASVAP